MESKILRVGEYFINLNNLDRGTNDVSFCYRVELDAWQQS